MSQRYYISSSSMNALKLTVFMVVMIVALSTLTEAYGGGWGNGNGSCCEYFHDNYKLIEEYIYYIITMFILAK